MTYRNAVENAGGSFAAWDAMTEEPAMTLEQALAVYDDLIRDRATHGAANLDAAWQHVRSAVMAEALARVEALPEPTLGLKGGVNRQAVLDLLR